MSTQPSEPRRRVSIAQAGGQLQAIVHDVEEHGPVEFTRDGEPVAVIVTLDEYRRLAPERPSLWNALQKFRAETDLEGLDIDSAMEGVRDRSPGRDTWAAYMQWRSRVNLDEIGVDDSFLEGIRDPSPGRDVEL